MHTPQTLDIAVIGAGPVGLALALHASRALPAARITLFDSRPLEQDVSADARTLALSLGSVQLLQRLRAWPADAAQAIAEVHVSQQPPSGLVALLPGVHDEPELRLSAIDEAVPMLGAVLPYGQLVAALQREWLTAASAEPERLRTRFGTAVAALKDLPDAAVEVDAGIVERVDLAVIAEGGVFAEQARNKLGRSGRIPITHDYRQTAWVGQVALSGGSPGVAFERFTRHGPAALLPLRSGRAALVWCVPSDDDPVRELSDAQRVAVLNAVFHPAVGTIVEVSTLKPFALGLNIERTLVQRRTVRIGNAAQTLHPVAGQGLNLGLRDAFELVFALRDARGDDAASRRGHWIDAALRRVEWSRAPDRWAMIAATDFLARSFTWTLPGLGAARGLALSALQRAAPMKSLLARRMMFGSR